MANQTYTDVQILDMTIHTLSNINVPIGLMKQIAHPISICVGNLTLLKEAIEQKQAEMMQEPMIETDDNAERITMQSEDGEEIEIERIPAEVSREEPGNIES